MCSALRYWISQADALVRKVAFNVVATVAKRLAHFQVNSPRELSLAPYVCMKISLSSHFEKLLLLYHSINLDRTLYIVLPTRGANKIIHKRID